MNEDVLAKEQTYYEAHRLEYLQRYAGKFLLIRGEEFHGAYDTFADALASSAEKFGDVPVFIKQVESDEKPLSFPALQLGILSADIS